MYKIIALYGAPSDPQHFRSYYQSKHMPLAARLPGLKAARYSFDIQGTAPYFCIWEGEFADEAAALAAMGSELGAQVAADVKNYTDGSFLLLHFPMSPGPAPSAG